ncbi:MAG: VanW family protein [Anaerolineales bacterium]|jgi:vancomycin resistance protein YoaR
MAATLAAAVSLLVTSAIGLGLYQSAYNGRIYLGVSVGGMDLSGLTAEQAAEQLLAGTSYPQKGAITFTDGRQSWSASPSQLGVSIDFMGTLNQAFRVGRSGDPWVDLVDQATARFFGRSLPVIMQYDAGSAQAFLQRIALLLNRPRVEAGLRINGMQVEAWPGQVGRQVDIPSTLSLLAVPLESMTDATIPLVTQQSAPLVLDASAQAQTAQALISEPFHVVLPQALAGDPGPWTWSPEDLSSMLTFREVNAGSRVQYALALDNGRLVAFLDSLAPKLGRPPQNPRFHFDTTTGQLVLVQPGVKGRSLDLAKSVSSIQAAVAAGQHQASLVLAYADPKVSDSATAASLGIRGLLPNGLQWTSFKGSSDARIHNIELAASKFDGVLVAPGEDFSMAQYLGDVSFDTGYDPALIIVGSRTILGAGGGVCQVSTTLYRAAFMTGFPITERYPHAYRVLYYENFDGPVHLGPGFDATVFVPQVDFRFLNDSPYWILMETDVDRVAGRLTWSFYSTSDGRVVGYKTSGLINEVDPPAPKWVETPSLSQPWQQVDWAVQGADVYVTRTVTLGSQVRIDHFNTHYMAWAAVCQYSPGNPHADGDPCPPK